MTKTEIDTKNTLFQHEIFIAAPTWDLIQRNMFSANIGNWGIDNLKKNATRRFHHAVKVRELLRRSGLWNFMEYKEIIEGDIDNSSYVLVAKEGFSWVQTERVIEEVKEGLVLETGVKIHLNVHPGAPLHKFLH